MFYAIFRNIYSNELLIITKSKEVQGLATVLADMSAYFNQIHKTYYCYIFTFAYNGIYTYNILHIIIIV